MFEWNLNEQVIEDLFKNSQSNASISLNLTRTSRQNQNQKQKLIDNQSHDIFSKAQSEINKYSNWIKNNIQNETSGKINFDSFIQKNLSLDFMKFDQNQLEQIQDKLNILIDQKMPLIQSDNQCKNCSKNKQLIYQISLQIQKKTNEENQYKKKINQMEIQITKENMLNSVQLNLLKKQKQQLQIKNKNISLQFQKLQTQIQKHNYQRTSYQFKNKTLQDKLQIMQKSFKGLSAAKNSTGHSDILKYPQSTITNMNQFYQVLYPQDCLYIIQKLQQIFKQKQRKQQKQMFQIARQKNSNQSEETHKQLFRKNSWRFKIYKLSKNILDLIHRNKQTVFKDICQQFPKGLFKNRNQFLVDRDYQTKYEQYQRLIKQYLLKIDGLSTQNDNLNKQFVRLKDSFFKEKSATNNAIKKQKQLQSQLKKSYDQKINEIQQLAQKLKQNQKKLRKTQQNNKQIMINMQNSFKKIQFLFKRQRTQKNKICLQFQNYKGPIRVYCMLKQKSKQQKSNHLIYKCENRVILQKQKKSFKFDQVFDSSNEESSLFESLKYLIRSSIDNNNLTIFSFGQKNSGKKQIIHGADKKYKTNSKQQGILIKTVQQIFTISDSQNIFFKRKISVRMIELLQNGNFIDLLDSNVSSKTEREQNKNMQRVVSKTIKYPKQFEQLHQKAILKRTNSSKDYSTMIINFDITSYQEGQNKQYKTTKFTIVQLMSFNYDVYLSEQQKFEKTCFLNLASTINCLCNYRKVASIKEDPLLNLLKPSISPQGKIVMIININKQQQQRNEILQSLKYGVSLKHLQKRIIFKESQNLRKSPSFSSQKRNQVLKPSNKIK